MDILKECGGTPEEVSGEYACRTVRAHAEILSRMPLMICHRRHDKAVAPVQADNLVRQIIKFRPENLYVYWFEGGHAEDMIDRKKVLDFLGGFSNGNTSNPAEIKRE